MALFMVELLTKCLKQPESNTDLFQFCEDAFIHLDESSDTVVANFPLFFSLHLASFFGVTPAALKGDLTKANELVFDLKEGSFTNEKPFHPHFIEWKQALITSELLNVRRPVELENMKLNQEFRRGLLHAYEIYYALHIQDFGTMKTLPVLKEILE